MSAQVAIGKHLTEQGKNSATFMIQSRKSHGVTSVMFYLLK